MADALDRPGVPVSTVVVLLSLAFGAGATDAFAYLALGGVFTANMTGNLVLLGLVQRPGYAVALPGHLVALVASCAAGYAGFVPTRGRRTTSRSDGRLVLLATVAAAQVLVSAGWLLRSPTPGTAASLALVGLSAVGMSLQMVFTREVGKGLGVTSTTFMSGMIADLVRDLARRVRSHRLLRLSAVLALVAGALAGALTVRAAPSLGPLPALAATVVALVVVVVVRHRAS